jgi:hypothetical protein
MSASFDAALQRFIVRAGANVNTLTRELLFEISVRLIEYSPVGDATYWQSPPPPGYVGGHFRANWQYSFGTAAENEIDGHTGQLPGNIRAEFPSNMVGVHYIINNAPYAQRLENGWSRQAPGPQAIVGRTIMDFQNMVRRAAPS